jgi:hypothetical protein
MIMDHSREITIYTKKVDHYIFVLLLKFAHVSFESSFDAE